MPCVFFGCANRESVAKLRHMGGRNCRLLRQSGCFFGHRRRNRLHLSMAGGCAHRNICPHSCYINNNPTGTASASLTLPQVPAGKNGYRYKALLTKNGCTAESAEVTLTVIDPVISITPQSGVVCEGNAHTYTANASSGTPAGYQWKKWNETTRVFDNISGATNATYEIGQVARIHEGQYAAAVTFGSN